MPEALIEDDVVATVSDQRPGARQPLIILDRLTEFLDSSGLGRGEMQIERLGHGHSCETFLLRRDQLEVVLRRAPRPPLTQGVHNIEREIRILTALNGAARAPRVLAACSTGAVMGAPFLVMQRVEGVVLDRSVPAALDTPAQRARIGEELADTLAELHACDVRALGLADIGRPSIDHVRHLQSIQRLWDKVATRSIPEIVTLADWLVRNVPDVGRQQPTLVHSDFRLGNVLFATTAPARLTATLDWETTILGDPLVDLGFLVGLYRDKGDDTGFLTSLSHVALGEGALSREQLARRYALQTGHSLSHFPWYLAFALYRTAVMGEGLFRRLLNGLTKDPFYEDFKDAVPELAVRGIGWASSPNRFV